MKAFDPNYKLPVSYTHLDVYKRQIRVFVIDSSLGLCGFVLAQEVEIA